MDKEKIILEIFDNYNPKEIYQLYKNDLKNVEIFSFEGNNKINSNFFTLPNLNGRIEITRFTDYNKLDIFNENTCLKVRYVIELDTNVVSYLRNFYDEKIKLLENYKIREGVEELIQELDKKRDNFLLGVNLYIWENLIKGKEDEVILLDNIKKAECVLNYKTYKTKDDVEDKKYLSKIEEIKKLKENIMKRYYIIYSLLVKTFYLKLKVLPMKEKLDELVNFINNQLFCYMEEEFLLCVMYLFDEKEVKNFFKQKKKESMTWDLLHLRLIKENILLNIEKGILNFPIILSSDKAFTEIMKINSIRAIVYIKETSKIIPINKKNILTYINSSNKIDIIFKEKILNKIFTEEENRKNKIDHINFRILSLNLEKELEDLKNSQLKKRRNNL